MNGGTKIKHGGLNALKTITVLIYREKIDGFDFFDKN